MSKGLGGHPIREATQAARNTLERCKAVGLEEEWAENRLLDFNLWAAGVGASSNSQSSLDKRLVSQQMVQTVVLGLLSALKTLLQECIDHGSESTTNSNQDITQGDDSADADDSTSERSDTFAPWPDIPEPVITDPGSRKASDSPLRRAMADVESVLSQLIRAGSAIRAAGTVSRLRKADDNFTFEDYRHLEDEKYEMSPKVDIKDLRDFKAHLITILFVRPLNYETEAGPDDGHRTPWTFATDFERLSKDQRSIIDQLLFANLRRRNRFAYAKRHAEKLAFHAEPDAPEDLKYADKEGPKKGDTARPAAGPEHNPNSEQPPNEIKPLPDLSHRNLMSETTPSEGTVKKAALDQIPQSQAGMSRKSVSLKKSGWPHPPPMSGKRASFRCPCCYQTLSTADSQQLRWRKHLSSDLYPFTCIFPGCRTDSLLFISRDAWKSHMQQEHRSSTYWECLACTSANNSAIYNSSEEFRSHTKLKHGQVIKEEDISKLMKSCERTNPLPIPACPLCIAQPEDKELEPETLLNHIAEHIHDLSLLSSPWADEPPEAASRQKRAAARKVRNWLGNNSTDGEREAGGEDPLPKSSLLDYFAESVDASSGADLESSTPRSGSELGSLPSFEEANIYQRLQSEDSISLEGHKLTVYSVAFSMDGRRLASGSADNTVRIWDAVTGACLYVLEGHNQGIESVAVSPNSKLVASGSQDNTVKIWDVATGALKQTLEGHGGTVWSVAFSPDSKLVASGSFDETVNIWEAATGAPQQTLEGHGDMVLSVVFSPDSKLVASGSFDKTVNIWEATTGALQQTLEGHGASVWSVAFSPDSKLVASGSEDDTIKIWDVATGALQQTLGHGGQVHSVVFSPDSKLVASGSGDGTIKIWDAATGTLQQTLEGHDASVWSVAFSPDSKLVASGSNDNTVKIWDATTL